MALMTADSVKLLDPLKAPINGYRAQAQNGLSDALGTLKTQAKQSQIGSGRVQGDYTGQVLDRAKSTASAGINNELAGVLGGASLQDAKSIEEYKRQMALAREIGSISKPNTMQEIISGLSGAAGTAGQGYSLYQALGKGGGVGSTPGSLPPDLSLYDPYKSGFARYQ